MWRLSVRNIVLVGWYQPPNQHHKGVSLNCQEDGELLVVRPVTGLSLDPQYYQGDIILWGRRAAVAADRIKDSLAGLLGGLGRV